MTEILLSESKKIQNLVQNEEEIQENIRELLRIVNLFRIKEQYKVFYNIFNYPYWLLN